MLGAANAAGQFGAYFRTDIHLGDSGHSSDTGRIYFNVFVLPANQSNGSVSGDLYSLPAYGFATFTDVVGRKSISGAATVVIAVDHGRSTAPAAAQFLSVWGKTYTAGPNGGEFTTTLPVTYGYLISSASHVDAIGVVQNSRKRTNVSVFNHMTAQTIFPVVTVFDQTGRYLGNFTLTVPPLSTVQTGIGQFVVDEPGGIIAVSLTSGKATAFAVTVDNLTNDGDLLLGSYRPE
ncbi:MAG: hypothetical protein ABIQ65_08460 [Thermoanaerobaculia bacterium]